MSKMQTTFVIRAVAPADVAAINTIYGENVLYGTASWELDPPDEAEMHRRMQNILTQGYPYFVAALDGKVVGYSYARGGTEIGLFDLDAAGGLTYRATYELRSNDYYSSRNYASRLVGRKLVFYTPTLLQPWAPRPWENLPALRRWQGDAAPPDFERILPATRIYRSDDDFDPREALALHTVTSCDLDGQPLQCD